MENEGKFARPNRYAPPRKKITAMGQRKWKCQPIKVKVSVGKKLDCCRRRRRRRHRRRRRCCCCCCRRCCGRERERTFFTKSKRGSVSRCWLESGRLAGSGRVGGTSHFQRATDPTAAENFTRPPPPSVAVRLSVAVRSASPPTTDFRGCTWETNEPTPPCSSPFLRNPLYRALSTGRP